MTALCTSAREQEGKTRFQLFLQHCMFLQDMPLGGTQLKNKYTLPVLEEDDLEYLVPLKLVFQLSLIH